ncbi:hypothetical protein V8F06_012133 [Rhypophila decipiens]
MAWHGMAGAEDERNGQVSNPRGRSSTHSPCELSSGSLRVAPLGWQMEWLSIEQGGKMPIRTSEYEVDDYVHHGEPTAHVPRNMLKQDGKKGKGKAKRGCDGDCERGSVAGAACFSNSRKSPSPDHELVAYRATQTSGERELGDRVPSVHCLYNQIFPPIGTGIPERCAHEKGDPEEGRKTKQATQSSELIRACPQERHWYGWLRHTE